MDIDLVRERLRQFKEALSGNVFSDLGRPNAGIEQARAIIAAEIIRTLDARGLSTREAERLT
jgi:hypothetical protein